MPRALRIERGELVDGKEKSSKEKNSEEKEALSPIAVLTAPDFFGVTTLTSTREENLFPSRFLLYRPREMCVSSWVERSEAEGSRGVALRFCCGIPRLRSEWQFGGVFSIVHFVLFVRRSGGSDTLKHKTANARSRGAANTGVSLSI
jgi:hypothetical protein